MTLRIYRPMNDMGAISSGFEHLINEFFGGNEYPEFEAGTRAPRVNISEDDAAYYLELDLPGMKQDDVKIILKNKQLTIEGERRVEEKNWVRREVGNGKIERRFELPEDVDSGKIMARFMDGVLTVTLAKREEAKPREIMINIK